MSVLKHTMLALDYAAKEWNDQEVNMAVCLHDSGKKECYDKYSCAFGHEETGIPYVQTFCNKWKVPNHYRDLALLSCEFHAKIHGCMGRGTNSWMRPKSVMCMFEQTGALRNPKRFKKILKVCEADAKGRGATPEQIKEFENKLYHQRQYLEECLSAVISLDTKSISAKMVAEGKDGKLIGESIRVARIDAIRKVQRVWKEKA